MPLQDGTEVPFSHCSNSKFDGDDAQPEIQAAAAQHRPRTCAEVLPLLCLRMTTAACWVSVQAFCSADIHPQLGCKLQHSHISVPCLASPCQCCGCTALDSQWPTAVSSSMHPVVGLTAAAHCCANLSSHLPWCHAWQSSTTRRLVLTSMPALCAWLPLLTGMRPPMRLPVVYSRCLFCMSCNPLMWCSCSLCEAPSPSPTLQLCLRWVASRPKLHRLMGLLLTGVLHHGLAPFAAGACKARPPCMS